MHRTPEILPRNLRAACLAEFDPNKRSNIRYFPDLHNFMIYDNPNRSLPIEKFLNTFQPFIGSEKVAELQESLTNYRLEFHKTADAWEAAYSSTGSDVDSCMTNDPRVRLYAHPQNKLACAALYAPGTNLLIARAVVNTDDKWWVRLFGDRLLLDKLQALGYSKVTRPREFRMYASAGATFNPDFIQTPYFDFSCVGFRALPETHDPTTGLVEVIINEGIQ